MAVIIPFVKDSGVFNPKDIKAMSKALDDVCKSLDLRADHARWADHAREVIARRIVDLARRGIRSPTVLRDRVLHEDRPDGVGLWGKIAVIKPNLDL